MTTITEKPDDRAARQLLMEIYVAGADRGFKSIDSFATWFVGGTAAGLGLILANLDKVAQFIEPATVGIVLTRVTIAFAFVLAAKFLGVLIATRAGTTEMVRTITKEWAELNIPFPTDAELASARNASIPAFSRFVERVTGERTRDKAFVAKRTLTMLSVATFLCLAAMGIIATAWIEISAEL